MKSIESARTIEAPDWLMAMFASIKLRSDSSKPDDLVFSTRTGKPHGRGNVLTRGYIRRWTAPAFRGQQFTRFGTRTRRCTSRTAAIWSRCRSASDTPHPR